MLTVHDASGERKPASAHKPSRRCEQIRNNEFDRYFLRSFSLFWPHDIANSSLKIIVDREAMVHIIIIISIIITIINIIY
jgi:hypothetical protein